jgi:hypothetical protein
VQEAFISKKSFDMSFSRSHKCKKCVGDKNPQGNQAHKGYQGQIFKGSEALNISRIIGQDTSRRERDHSRSLDLGKVHIL